MCLRSGGQHKLARLSMASRMQELLTIVCSAPLSAFTEWSQVGVVAIWDSRKTVITIGACERNNNASGVGKLGTEDGISLGQLPQKYGGAASKDGGVQ